MGSAVECEAELAARLRNLTGLDCMVPAVSGATAVENALKLALVAQFPKRHVLALKAGFGGKTLLALTGTANPSYKDRIDPLYADVLYVDPFAPDAETQIEAALGQHPVAVVQVELIQAVGGVRRIPDKVIRYLDTHRQRFGYLLLVDEVADRHVPHRAVHAIAPARPDAGPAAAGQGHLGHDVSVCPDAVFAGGPGEARCGRVRSPAVIRNRYSYEFGYKTVLNVLRLAEALDLPARVTASGALFAKLLNEGLASCSNVREVRVHGLLIGIELDATRWPLRWFRKRLYSFYLYGMLRHRRFHGPRRLLPI